MITHSDIENSNKESDERDQIYKGGQLDKKCANVKEGLSGSNEVLKLLIMSSKSFMDKDSGERDQRDNDDQIVGKIAEFFEEILTGDKESYKRYNIDRVYNKKSDDRFQVQKKQANKMNLE